VAVSKTTIIEAVGVAGSGGSRVEYPWEPKTWYLIRDDCPYLDVLIRGFPAQAKGDTKLEDLSETARDGAKWQRWNLETELARQRRLGEMSLALKVPKDCTLRCYVVPTSLLSYRDVIAMVEDIEAELGVDAAWDTITERPDRSWSRRSEGGRLATPTKLVGLVDDELRAAFAVRRDPFSELGPQSRRGLPLAENAVVSHWAMRRHGQLRESAASVATELKSLRSKGARRNPEGRQKRIAEETTRLVALERKITDLTGALARLSDDLELMTVVFPSPVFQRDYRLRQLLRAFAPRISEALSSVESSRSHFPPVFLNDLWELWGAIWLVKEFRRLGFEGTCSTDTANLLKSCSWHLKRDGIEVDLDYEPEPVFVDYDRLPAAHDRDMPALEWAARNQDNDVNRPFFGTELRCSPDYIIRITVSEAKSKTLMVGDACLASARHHGRGPDKSGAKPYTVENYRRTLGWATEKQIVRCHPMGGFVVFPSPATAWEGFQRLPGAGDCTLLCPSPQGDPEASRRLENLLCVLVPEIRQQEADSYGIAS
jgi:hypothetical protein